MVAQLPRPGDHIGQAQILAALFPDAVPSGWATRPVSDGIRVMCLVGLDAFGCQQCGLVAIVTTTIVTILQSQECREQRAVKLM